MYVYVDEAVMDGSMDGRVFESIDWMRVVMVVDLLCICMYVCTRRS